MKTRFNTYDIICSVAELQKYVGMRVNQVYDIDNKTYLIRLQRPEEKCILLLESGNRFHTTAFEWPKSTAPSGFSMKLRKHLNNKRLEKLTQLGIDRIVDFQFGSGEAAYHVILELYDRGNIILTDYNWIILNVLRPHTEGEVVRFAVKEQYPMNRAKEKSGIPSEDKLKEIFQSSKPGENLKKILNPNLEYGPAIIDHVLAKTGLMGNLKVVSNSNDKGFYLERDLPTLIKALNMAEEMMETASKSISKGYIIQKREERPKTKEKTLVPDFLLTNQEFHPFLYAQYEDQPYKLFDTFDQAVDEFFSTLEGQKIDVKALQIEREAMKKLQNVKKDHEKRLTDLNKTQKADREKADLIIVNQKLVDAAILAIQSAIATQLSWTEINELVKVAQQTKDPVAMSIKHLKLEKNQISLMLKDPFIASDSEEEEDEKKKKNKSETSLKPLLIDIDLGLTAYGNARKYFDQKRSAAKKEQKTVESQGKALKSAEKKTMQTLKEVQTITNINKARKVYWFEKFYWFISSENYLIIGGRDQIQNEMIVKRYMKPTDIYVHADITGASSIIIINPSGNPVPPKTLNEAGQMAISYSIAWEAKVVTSAWWVHASQVSKSAPTGEYLTTGSFMIRGKKNFLPPCILALGFTFMFKLEESSIARHENERKVMNVNDEIATSASETQSNAESQNNEDQEIVLSDDDDEDDDEDGDKNMETITEDAKELDINKSESKSNTSEEENTDSDDESTNFPDTHIKVEHDTGKIIMRSNVRTLSSCPSEEPEIEENENVIYLGDDKPITLMPSKIQKGKKPKKKETKENNKQETEKVKPNVANKQNTNVVKRGQHGKLKKIKEKYKDQDDEDKALARELLKPDGPKKESKKTSKKKGQNQLKTNNPPKPSQPKPQKPSVEKKDENDADIDDEEDAPKMVTDTDILCQLTGCPVAEDELLFAIPVIAPYSALHNYKYKVKLTPGMGKRGKAARTAVQIFMKDKTCTPREKDLLKAVKDENLARNLPGKVKLSAPQMQKIKK